MSERRGTKGLELWCRRITEGYPGVKIDNMTTSWRDGLAFCALIHHFRPDLIEFTELNKEDVYHNNELAFRVAEQYLGIPALLEPEDMVEYTVPDRLSILTYLSQFYQAFAVGQGKSGGRLAPKRAQTTPDHGIVSPTSTSPPTKVAHIGAGRMRRDPCAKCGLPVFIAERLNVGKLLYHRTCFRCARCNSQLTLANYYETESAQFCCEICPDEEKSTAKKGAVLNRSVSDEEKSASLTTFSELDSYSAQFESALEFPNDTELKKNFTLKSQDNTVYSAARSHFFKSQMENSDSGNEEDIPPDLPKSVPPPKEVTKVSMDNSDSSFSKVKETLNHVNKSSVSEDKQNVTAQNNLVTKDNARSPSIVKARMKLFEDNNKNSTTVFNQKSDVYNISSRFSNTDSDRNKNIKVPSSEVVVPMPASKHEAKVVSLEDLEDFDNISRKDVNLKFEKSDSNKESLEPTKIIKESSDSLDLQHSDIENADKKHILEVNNLETENEPISYTISSEDSVIEISNGTTSSSKKYVEAHHSDSGSVVVIDDSYSNSTEEVNNTSTQKENITDEVIPKIIHESEVDIEISTQTKECSTVNKSEELSIVNTSVNRNALDINEQTDPSVNVDTNVVSENEKDITEINTSAIYSSSHCEYSSNNKSEELSIPNTSVNSNALCVNEETNRSANVDMNIASKNEKDIEINNLAIDSSSNHDPIIIKEDLIQSVNSDNNNLTNKQMIEKQESYPEDLNPFGDPEENDSKLYQSTLNPFGDYDVDDKTNDKALNIQKSIPVASPRMKKKILPTEEDKLITGTPDCLKRIYIERISVNPFEECDDVEQQEAPPQPADRRKKISAPKISLTPWNYKNLENKTQKQSLNPFESDDESSNAVEETQGKEASEFAISAPVPKPRISLTSAPEPKPRDHSFGLSLSSRSSFGGSNESSLSSAGAIGSARKKKPAPRPPVPTAFRAADNNTADSGGSSLTSSPSQSVVPSPHLQVKHRKTKRAPLPPTSTSTPLFSEENVIKPYTGNVSPIKFPETTEVKDSVNENDVEQEKSFKDEANRNRQSQDLQYVQSPTSNDNNANICAPNKSTFGKWKRHKGKAPARPIPQRRSIKSLPLADIRRELDVIEIQQQGLEKQGVKIEQIIREKCEGDDDSNPDAMLPIEVEDLILQLFELVNEKNELFRKQAELMYLRRQQRLEEEHADVEYQIRCLMLQPEANKTDSDKAMEEELIQRLVDIVERRNEIIECLELDRVREAEEDDSINNQINLYTQSREIEKEPTPKKEKKHKKDKKINKLLNTLKHKEKDKHKIDADKDVDESETNTSVEKKKKKKFNLF